MKKLLDDIDDLLARLEDFTHGEDGMDITRMRKRISLAAYQLGGPGEICEHKEKDYVPGVFGGVYCKDCNAKVE